MRIAAAKPGVRLDCEMKGHFVAARRCQKSSNRLLTMQERNARIASAPATVQRMPPRLRRLATTFLRPAPSLAAPRTRRPVPPFPRCPGRVPFQPRLAQLVADGDQLPEAPALVEMLPRPLHGLVRYRPVAHPARDARHSTHFGPCPGSPSRAQWQVGLPHRRQRACNVPGRRSPTPANSPSNASRCPMRTSISRGAAMGPPVWQIDMLPEVSAQPRHDSTFPHLNTF